MARQLYVKQKKFLDSIMKRRVVYSCGDLRVDELIKLRNMHNYETVINDADRHIRDKVFTHMYGRR